VVADVAVVFAVVFVGVAFVALVGFLVVFGFVPVWPALEAVVENLVAASVVITLIFAGVWAQNAIRVAF